MNKAISMSVAAGVLAFALAAGTAQAAPAGAGIVGKLTSAAPAATQVEKAGWRHRHHRWHRRHWNRRCYWRHGYRHCRRHHWH